MKLDIESERDLLQTRPGYGVIFINVAEDDIQFVEFFSATDGTLRTATPQPSSTLHEWIDSRHRESKEIGEGEKRKMQYEDKISEVLKLAKNAKNEGDLDKLCSLEKSLIKARIYRLDDPRKADQILDRALGKGDTGD
jgi:hypothetical protein